MAKNIYIGNEWIYKRYGKNIKYIHKRYGERMLIKILTNIKIDG